MRKQCLRIKYKSISIVRQTFMASYMMRSISERINDYSLKKKKEIGRYLDKENVGAFK